jgi:uncharacterized phage protein gp47/JayE
MTSSVPPVTFSPTGVINPDEADILAGVQADYNAAFGGNLNFGTTDQPGGAPPQVQLAGSTAAIIADSDSTFTQFVNQVDPDNAEGFMQDAIGRIYFLNRIPGAPTAVQLLCGGELGTPIPVGSQAKDTSGNIYVCTEAGVIPSGGSITLSFANIINGPIACPANTVTQIYLAIPGWETVNNPAAGVPGSNVETAAAFEFRRQNSVAANGHGSLPSIYGEVFEVPGVIDLYAFENVGDDPIVVGSTNYTLVGHSMYIGVVGGAAQAVGNAIWTKKDLGCNYNGNTTVTVTDPSGYSFPLPSYQVTFNVPNSTPYNVIVNIVNSSALPSTIVQDVTQAVTQQFNGVTNTPIGNGVIPQTSGQRVRIGSLLLAASFYGAVATCEGPSVPVQVLSIFIGSPFVGLGTVVDGTEVLTVTTATSGSLTSGTVLTMTGVPTGTTVVQQLSGTTGGIGTYQMSTDATATEGSPIAIAGAGGTAQQIGIDQAPVLGSVTVNLI